MARDGAERLNCRGRGVGVHTSRVDDGPPRAGACHGRWLRACCKGLAPIVDPSSRASSCHIEVARGTVPYDATLHADGLRDISKLCSCICAPLALPVAPCL